MKIAVVLTTYNQEKYIERTIESVLAQDFADWELFVGDDRSSDTTFAILSGYAERDERIHIWQNEVNLGIVGNMNALLEKIPTEVEYIAFLEGDDILVPGSLGDRLSVFTRHGDVDLVYSDVTLIDAEDRVICESYFHSRGMRLVDHRELTPHEYLLQVPTVVLSYSSMMVRRSALTRLGGIPNPTPDQYFSVSDYDLCFRLMTTGVSHGITRPLTLYRRHTSNYSSAGGKIYRDMLRLIETYRERSMIDTGLYHRKMALANILEIRNLLGKPGCLSQAIPLLRSALTHDTWILGRSWKFTILACLTITPIRLQQFIIKSLG